VLDAVVRIEQILAAQKQPAADDGLAQALAAIGGAVEEARAAASAALDSLALEENLDGVRRGARVIKEISGRWREIGADGRICDLLDSQVSAIETGCGRISSTAPRAVLSVALNAAFDLIAERIEEFDERDAAPSQAEQEDTRPPSPSPALSDEMLAAAVEAVRAANTTDDAKAAMDMPAMAETAEAAIGTAEAVDVTAEAVEVTAEAVEVTAEAVDTAAEARDAASEAAEVNPEAADAFDDALLDMIALEMAAPDASGSGDNFDRIHPPEPPPEDAEPIAERPEPAVAPQPLPVQASFQPPLEASLGSTLIANGIVRRPHAGQPDPLALIRRMSQAEKIALFS